MQGFDDFVLSWQGQQYRVPANRQMELILRIESGLMRGENGVQAAEVLSRPQGPPTARLAATYADALRYAGAPVSDMDVHGKMMLDLREGSGVILSDIVTNCAQILGLIGADDDGDIAEPTEGKKPQAAAG